MRSVTFFIFSLVLLVFSCNNSKTVSQTSPATEAQPAAVFSSTPLESGHISIDEVYVEACTYLIREDWEQAEASFRNILSQVPNHHASLYHLAGIYQTKRKFREALEFARPAVLGDPDNIWYRKRLIQIYEQQGNLKKALEEQVRVHIASPDNRKEWQGIAELQHRMGLREESLSTLAALHDQLGTTVSSLRLQVKWLTESNHHPEAVLASKELLEKDPDNPQWRNIHYHALLRTGDSEAALHSLEAWLASDPQNGQVQILLSEGYRRNGEVDKADEWLLKAFRNTELEAGWKARYLDAHQQDDTFPIPTLLEALTATHPDAPEALAVSARMRAANQPAEQVQILLRQSLDADPESFDTWIQLLESSFQEGRYDLLYADSRHAREFFPNSDQVLYYYGLSACAMTQYAKAKRAFQKLELLDPENKVLMARALSEAARIYQQEQNTEEVSRLLKVTGEITSNDPFVNSRLAWIKALQGVKDRFVDRSIEAYLDQSPSHAGKALQAFVLHAVGNHEQSLALIREATNGSEIAEWLLLLGDLERDAGYKAAALEAYTRAYNAGADIQPDLRLQTP